MERIQEINISIDTKKRIIYNKGHTPVLSYFDTEQSADFVEFIEDVVPKLLAENKRYKEALQYYANLHEHLYHDAVEGELYADWWARQSEVAIKALKEP